MAPTQTLELRFYGGLCELLPPERRRAFTHEVSGAPAIKDVIEALGVPHPEVELVLANGASVDFAWRAEDGARVSVYPAFHSLDVAPLSLVRPEPLPAPRFLLDGHLGRLARYLRLLGLDAALPPGADDAVLAELAARQQRILLTRDRGLLKRSQVTHGYCVRSTEPRTQAAEILRRFEVGAHLAPWTRCLRCNGLLEPAPRASVAARVPARSLAAHADFRRCVSCGQPYWEGSHHWRLAALVDALLAPGRVHGGPAEEVLQR